MGWFGLRGIGSLYYLAYVFARRPATRELLEVAHLTVTAVAVSIVVHGLSSQPLLAIYSRRLTHRADSLSPPNAG